MPFPLFFAIAAGLGARESFLNKRRKDEMLDAEAERQDEINNIDVGIDSMGVGNQFDARQIEAMNKQFQTAQGMLRSQDSKLQALGANMIADFDTAVRGNIQQNETEARADKVRQQDQEVVQAGIMLASNEARFARELVMNKQLNDELKSYTVAKVSYDKVINLLDNNDQLASLSGLTAFVQSIDNSVVREGELLKYQGANGLITQLVNIVNKTSGKDFDEVTKISIRNASAAILNAEKTRATAITNSFQDRAIGFSLDPERVLSGVDQTLFTPMQINKDALEIAQQEGQAAEDAMSQGLLTPVPPTMGSKLITPMIEGTNKVLGDIRRRLVGARLFRNAQGDLFEQAQDGTMTPAGRNDFFETADGRILRLVDRGNGRFEWIEENPQDPGELAPPAENRQGLLEIAGRKLLGGSGQ